MSEFETETPSAIDPGDAATAASGSRHWIVGIGASAGGLAPVTELLAGLPVDLDMAYVVVMHLDPNHDSSLAPLLERACQMPVHLVTDGAEVEPGHVYVIPPNRLLTVSGGVLHLRPRGDSRQPTRPIDVFLSSLAEEREGRSIGVILSGTGSDGTAGLQAIQATGGITFAQDESAEYGEMPSTAVEAGCVGAVLGVAGITVELARIARHPLPWVTLDARSGAVGDQDTEAILTTLVRRLGRTSGIDFLNYKPTTVRRRIQRRMVLLGLQQLDEYVSWFDEHPEEADLLARDILIHVTSFFRDPEVFEVLTETVFPAIVANRNPDDPIRLWTPGCSTGEEAYSVAICLLEFLERRSLSFPIKLFGTDVSEHAVAAARTGRYPERIARDVSPERLRNYFARDPGGYTIVKGVRDLCVFARQDATRDPPFSNVDLITCRNLLIYLGPALQKRLMPVLHYALRDGGFLVLGSAESVGTLRRLFATVDERRSVYRRKHVPRRPILDLVGFGGRTPMGDRTRSVGPTSGSGDARREADRVVLARYAPPGVVIDDNLEILQFRGNTGAFLAPAPGAPSNNLLRMAREGLFGALASSIEEARERDLPVRRDRVQIQSESRAIRAHVEVSPIRVPGTDERCYVVLFDLVSEQPDQPPPEEPDVDDPHADRLEKLQRELVAVRDHLRANVERLEGANEELRAANQEVLSGNEELRSTNEELQTAKEELQASNQELSTMNAELEHRNQQVALLGDDLTNLLSSVKIPLVILGRDLCVRRFTPGAGRVFELTPADIGRRIGKLQQPIAGHELETMARQVLESLAIVERDVTDAAGHWYVLSVRPYRTQDDKVDGAVIALSDIDSVKRVAQEAERARDFVKSVVMSLHEPLLVLDAQRRVLISNRRFHEVFGTTPDSVEGLPLGEGPTAAWVSTKLLGTLARLQGDPAPFDELAVQAEIPERGLRDLRLSARCVDGPGQQRGLVLLTVDDVTDREREREETERLANRVREAQRLESLGVLAGGIAHDFNNILASIMGFAELVRADLPPDSPLHSDVDKILQGAGQAAALSSEMLAYSGRGRFEVKTVELTGQVRESARLIEAMVGKKTVVDYELADDLPPVQLDVAQFHQVLANLVLNGSEALGEAGGRVTIRTGVFFADRAYLDKARVGDVAEGEYVYLEVADEGLGMSADTAAHIFDPFFTTKFTGRGLGLAAVLGIVRGHGGAMCVQSGPGQGASFRWLVPPAVGGVPEPPPAVRATIAWQGDATVLVVDDEPSIRALFASLLPRLGCRVEMASHGREALDLLGATESIDLVLLDMTMPGLSTAEVLRGMLRLRPDLPIVAMSGYDQEEVLQAVPAHSTRGFLAKPFGLDDLAAVLLGALGQTEDQARDGASDDPKPAG